MTTRTTSPRLELPPGFGFSEDHELTRAGARKFLEKRVPHDAVRRIAESDSGRDAELEQELAELGWLGLGFPEAMGGTEVDGLHVGLLFDEMGRALLPTSFFGTWLALEALRRGASSVQLAELAPPLVSGERTAALALYEAGGRFEPNEIELEAEHTGAGYRLDGEKVHVIATEDVDVLVVAARETDGTLSLFWVERSRAGVRIEAERGVDATRRMVRVVLEDVEVPERAKLEGSGQRALEATLLRGAAMLACEMVGGAEALLGLTRDYAVTRIQFGKPIGRFQAVKHPIVDAMVGIEQARSLALAAAVACDGDLAAAESTVRAAKAFASDVYVSVAKKAVQLHGGFGFTWDCDVHLWFKRAVVSRGLFGAPAHHRHLIARELFGSGASVTAA